MRSADLSTTFNYRSNWRILLIDDNEDDFILIRAMLSEVQEENIWLEWASTYQAGVDAMSTGAFDAILLCAEIGAHSGIELIRKTVSKQYPAPILLLSCRGHPEADIEALQAGAADFLHKEELNTGFLERSIRYAIERRLMQNELEKNIQDRLDLLESIQDGFFAIDREWRVKYINQRAAQQADLAVEDLLGKNILEAFPKIKGTLLEANYRKVMTERLPMQFEMRGIYKSQWYSNSVYPTSDGIAIYWQDITDRKRAEEALREALDQAIWMARFPDENPNPVSRVAIDGTVLYCNQATKDIPGWQCGIDQKVMAPLFPLIQQAVSIGQQIDQDVVLGDKIYAFSVMPFLSERYVNLYGRDVTERRRAEEALRESEAREHARANELETLMDAVPTMICITRDSECREMIGNRAGYEFLGMQQGENISKSAPNAALANQHYQNIKDGRPIPASEMPMQIAAATGKPTRDFTFDLVFDDGTTFHLIGNVDSLFDADGKPCGAIGCFVDITELRNLQTQQLELRTQMEIHRRLMEQRENDRQAIARDIHDGPVQTLSSTLFNIQFALGALTDPKLHVEFQQIGLNVKNAIQELRQVIYELRPPSVIRFGLAKAIRYHAEELRDRYPELKLALHLADDGNRLSELIVLTLYRIYQEAITNVIRHAEANNVWVRFRLNKRELVLEIRDNGKGLPVEENFKNMTENGHFGLAGIQERVEAIGGNLAISSDPGKGTSVKVRVPVPKN